MNVSFLSLQVLLKSAELSLVYGRRYGMVGRNGLGKSTLLKMVSSGQLIIQSHISVLHVEQESDGNVLRQQKNSKEYQIIWQ